MRDCPSLADLGGAREESGIRGPQNSLVVWLHVCTPCFAASANCTLEAQQQAKDMLGQFSVQAICGDSFCCSQVGPPRWEAPWQVRKDYCVLGWWWTLSAFEFLSTGAVAAGHLPSLSGHLHKTG